MELPSGSAFRRRKPHLLLDHHPKSTRSLGFSVLIPMATQRMDPDTDNSPAQHFIEIRSYDKYRIQRRGDFANRSEHPRTGELKVFKFPAFLNNVHDT